MYDSIWSRTIVVLDHIFKSYNYAALFVQVLALFAIDFSRVGLSKCTNVCSSLDPQRKIKQDDMPRCQGHRRRPVRSPYPFKTRTSTTSSLMVGLWISHKKFKLLPRKLPSLSTWTPRLIAKDMFSFLWQRFPLSKLDDIHFLFLFSFLFRDSAGEVFLIFKSCFGKKVT